MLNTFLSVAPVFNFELWGGNYELSFAFLDDYIVIVRNLISFILYAKFFYSKYKALPSIIAQIPSISGESGSSQIPGQTSFF